MNKFVMVIWGLLIFALWGIILLIAYKQQDRVYIDLTSNLKYAGKMYVKDNNIDLKFNESSKIYIDDLIEKEYIKEDKNIKKYCIDSIIVHRGLFGNEYDVNIDCKKEE